MAAKAIIRLGDPTSHGGTVIEAFPTLNIYGKPAAGIGHKVSCPKCKGVFPIIAGAANYLFMGKNVALEGMQTACGAILIPTQGQATVDVASGASTSNHAASNNPKNSSSLVCNDPSSDDDMILEQWFTIEDEHGNPVEGYKYDLYKEGTKHTHSASYDSGKTTIIDGDAQLDIVMWLAKDSAART